MTRVLKTKTIFLRPFKLEGFDETLPAGEYAVETEINVSAQSARLPILNESVTIRLHPRASSPGLDRSLTVPLAELDRALVDDQRTDRPLRDIFLEEMLAEPIVQLLMKADGFTPSEVRDLYAGVSPDSDKRQLADDESLDGTDHDDGMGPRWASSRPGIGE